MDSMVLRPLGRVSGWLPSVLDEPSEASRRALGQSKAGYSSNPFLLFGHRSPAGLCLGFGLGQEAEARLAPREINAYVQQSIGTPAWAGKFHARQDTVGLPDLQGHWPARGMVRRGIDA